MFWIYISETFFNSYYSLTPMNALKWVEARVGACDVLAILLHARWICDSTALRSPSKCFPRYDCFEGTWSRKMRFSLLSKFYLNRSQMRTNVFCSRCGKDLNGAIGTVKLIHREARQLPTTVRAAMMIWVFLIDYARRMRRLTIDISRIDRFFIDVIRRCD